MVAREVLEFLEVVDVEGGAEERGRRRLYAYIFNRLLSYSNLPIVGMGELYTRSRSLRLALPSPRSPTRHYAEPPQRLPHSERSIAHSRVQTDPR